ncbi:MAG: hypothetical protein KC419_15760 [Anaerolineales bacterium]|nr:hypothetical protein [Anaerolineales bacterium]
MTDDFYPAPLRVPERLETAVFTIRPLTPDHVALDYAAVMAGKEMLRLWSGSRWPTDDFTQADNLNDLEWHDLEHQERIAFTYTVLTPDESECLGCVYIKSLADLQKHQLEPHITATNRDSSTRFWIKTPRLAEGMDVELLDTLHQWVNTTWQFNQHTFHVRAAHKQQVALLENSRLTRRFVLNLPDRGGLFYFYG